MAKKKPINMEEIIRNAPKMGEPSFTDIPNWVFDIYQPMLKPEHFMVLFAIAFNHYRFSRRRILLTIPILSEKFRISEEDINDALIILYERNVVEKRKEDGHLGIKMD